MTEKLNDVKEGLRQIRSDQRTILNLFLNNEGKNIEILSAKERKCLEVYVEYKGVIFRRGSRDTVWIMRTG